MKFFKSFNKDTMQNISSKSKGFVFKDPIDLYGSFLHRNLGKVIKLVAYVVGIVTFLFGLVGAYFIGSKQFKFVIIAIAVILVSAIFALIEFFIIYGLGHIIEQNNEMMNRLD